MHGISALEPVRAISSRSGDPFEVRALGALGVLGSSCGIEGPLVDRLTRALKVLRQRAEEQNWEPDWNEFLEHNKAAEDANQSGDLAPAFGEFCRAMLPLTEAVHRQHHKEEVFQPLWEKKQSSFRIEDLKKR